MELRVEAGWPDSRGTRAFSVTYTLVLNSSPRVLTFWTSSVSEIQHIKSVLIIFYFPTSLSLISPSQLLSYSSQFLQLKLSVIPPFPQPQFKKIWISGFFWKIGRSGNIRPSLLHGNNFPDWWAALNTENMCSVLFDSTCLEPHWNWQLVCLRVEVRMQLLPHRDVSAELSSWALSHTAGSHPAVSLTSWGAAMGVSLISLGLHFLPCKWDNDVIL